MFLVKLEVAIYIIFGGGGDGACHALAYVHLLKKEFDFHF